MNCRAKISNLMVNIGIGVQLLILISLLFHGTLTHAVDRDGEDATEALRLYHAGDYAGAAKRLEGALQISPDNAGYYRWLGMAYGRLAQKSNWFKAIGLSRKTRRAFERAVELDPANAAALSDLIEYYRSAPAFLGGSERKARALEQRLEAINRGENVHDGHPLTTKD